ncbi:MAG: mechanosensitive ion channel family protein, partial [Burkholderiales bacterium]
AVHIIIILVLSWFAVRLARRLTGVFKSYMGRQTATAGELRRVETVSQVLHHTVSIVVFIVAGMLILSVLGISVAPILATAGVAGIAVGFAAQTLIKDYFSGFFLLLENQVRQGDVIEAAGKGGLVEEVTLRYIRLRDFDGNVHFIPNGSIGTVTNRSRGFAYSVMDIGVGYGENVDAVFDVMRAVAAEMREDPVSGPKILEDLEIAGVESWADSAIILRCRLKVMPLEQCNTRREYLRRLKYAFDVHGIEIPYPHLTVYAGQNKDGSAPAFRIEDSLPSGEAAPATTHTAKPEPASRQQKSWGVDEVAGE